jgi:hypothetical protein
MSALESVSTLLDLIQSVSGVSKIDLLNSIAIGSVGVLQTNLYNLSPPANGLALATNIIPKLPNSRILVEIRISFTGTAPRIFWRRFLQNTTNFVDEQMLSTLTLVSGSGYQFFALMTRGEQYNIYADHPATLDIKAIEYRMGL